MFMNNFNRFKAQDAAKYLGLTESTIAKWRMSGRGPRYIKAGARVLYDRADLDAWLETSKRENTSQKRGAENVGFAKRTPISKAS